MTSFSRETDVTKFVSKEIATDTSRRRRIPMPASPRRRARCDRHEARAGNVALMSCCLVQLSNEVWAFLVKLSHYQRAQREVFAVVPLLRAAWIHWLSVVISEAAAKHFSVCSTEHPFQIQNVNFYRARELGLRTSHIGFDRKRNHLRSHQFPRSRRNCTITRLASRLCGARFLQS